MAEFLQQSYTIFFTTYIEEVSRIDSILERKPQVIFTEQFLS